MTDNIMAGAEFAANPGSTLSPQQSQELASKLVSSGLLTGEDAKGRLEAAGIAPAEETRTEEQIAFDNTFPAAKPNEYKLELAARSRGVDVGTVAKQMAAMGNFLSGLGLPKGLGEAIGNRIPQTAAHVERMTETQRTIWKQQQRIETERLLGENWPDRIAAVAPYLNNAKLSAIGANPAVLGDAWLITQLVLHGERLAARAGQGRKR